MSKLEHRDLLDSGVHYGHIAKKWNPNMSQFIFMKYNNIHVIDINKTLLHLQEAASSLKNLARDGKKILFVATKKQARLSVESEAKRNSMPYVTERWLGGTLTNFITIRRLLKKWASLEKLIKSDTFNNLIRREQLTVERKKDKLSRLLYGISDVTRLPAALFIVDLNKEHNAFNEARRLGIPVYALVDTDANPTNVDFVIPGNDDSDKSIRLILGYIGDAIAEGLMERQKRKNDSTTDMPVEIGTEHIGFEVSRSMQGKNTNV
jgi:small subunit ribosomal protein S2